MVSAKVVISGSRKAALIRAESLLRAQAKYLADTDSKMTLPVVNSYLTTLERLTQQEGETSVSGEERNHLQQVRSLLEGARVGFRNAEFDDRAAKLDADIAEITDVIKEYNAERAQSEG